MRRPSPEGESFTGFPAGRLACIFEGAMPNPISSWFTRGRPAASTRSSVPGTYITLDAGGFHYQELLPAPTSSGLPTDGEIHTASAGALAQSSPDLSLHAVQEHLRRPNLFAWYLGSAGALAVWGHSTHSVVGALAVLLGLGFSVPVFRWDRRRRTAHLSYDLQSAEIAERVSLANAVGQSLGRSRSIWHIHHAVATSDRKRNAGANTLIRRTATRSVAGSLGHIKLNIEPWCVPVGPQQLLFLPDRLLVWDGSQLAGVAYADLSASAAATRFIETERIPSDARQVDTTWRFVNKNGGPDRRFSGNTQLPVMEYGELELRSSSGMRVFLHTSSPAAASGAAEALNALARREFRRAPTTTPAIERRPLFSPRASEIADERLVMHAATLLRYIAAADRRITDEEVAYAERALASLRSDGASPPPLRELPGDAQSVEAAFFALAAASEDTRHWLLARMSELAGADGKATPKERERLAEARARLGVAA